jgi:hypothetical protein
LEGGVMLGGGTTLVRMVWKVVGVGAAGGDGG